MADRINKFDIILCHQEYFDDKKNHQILNEASCIKILATHQKNIKLKIFNEIILLPTSVKELNNIVEGAAAKKFNANSFIKIKSIRLIKIRKSLTKEEYS